MSATSLERALAMTAMTGILTGLAACGSGAKVDPTTPTTNVEEPPPDKSCCKAKNECRAKSGCKTETNTSCAGLNECKGKGTSCPKG
jgi:hypothetical protein